MNPLRLLRDQFHRFFEMLLRAWPSMDRPDRLVRFLNRQPGIRLDVVKKLGHEQGRITQPVSASEMAAILVLWCEALNHGERIERLDDAIRAGWIEDLGDNFYRAVEKMARDLDITGATKLSADLLKMGFFTARALGKTDWTQKFNEKHLRMEERARRPVIRYR